MAMQGTEFTTRLRTGACEFGDRAASFGYSVDSSENSTGTLMNITNLFFYVLLNRVGRLRSGWRFAVFALAYIVTVLALWMALQLALASVLPARLHDWLLGSNWGFVLQSVALFIPAVLVGWMCNYALEDLPRRALGWTFQSGWPRDLAAGLLLGAASNVLAALIAVVFGGMRFTLAAHASWLPVWQTLLFSALVFLCGAAAEETMFRGYPFQTLLRSWPVWIALLPTSVPFALGHFYNPNVAPGFTIANTVLAGAWLAVAYSRTRSLWFPLGLHWSWNWTMGALLGIPVSGITKITPEPLLRATDAGPFWLTGGTYGLEGGAACTVTLLLATLFIWRTRLVSANEELKQLTSEENPGPSVAPLER
ncbi:MAG: CPBP family intramembrane metalloprotease [Acidobacteria bacterium]|nr:CPBP family intramembrane metalloprotease [Acidobacteriota bacterium]